jgi:environmental stress-induced protein Ves
MGVSFLVAQSGMEGDTLIGAGDIRFAELWQSGGGATAAVACSPVVHNLRAFWRRDVRAKKIHGA